MSPSHPCRACGFVVEQSWKNEMKRVTQNQSPCRLCILFTLRKSPVRQRIPGSRHEEPRSRGWQAGGWEACEGRQGKEEVKRNRMRSKLKREVFLVDKGEKHISTLDKMVRPICCLTSHKVIKWHLDGIYLTYLIRFDYLCQLFSHQYVYEVFVRYETPKLMSFDIKCILPNEFY